MHLRLARDIVFIDQYPFFGGGQIVLLSLIKVAVEIFDKILVLAPGGGELENRIKYQFSDRVEFRAVSVLNASHGRKSVFDVFRLLTANVATFIKWRKVISSSSLIYLNGPRYLPFAYFSSCFYKIPAIYHIHIRHSIAEKMIYRMIAKSDVTRHFVTNSLFIHIDFLSALKTLSYREKVKLVENGLNDEFQALEFVDRFRECDTKKLSIAVIGTIRPEKGQDIVVDALRNKPDCILHVVGRVGQGVADWFSQLQSASPENVMFHDATVNVPEFIDHYGVRVVVVPSRWEEPFGLVAIEAMACSCVAIVSNRGGLVDIASKTGALTYSKSEELLSVLNWLSQLSSIELSELAFRQFSNTKSIYSYEKFALLMGSVMRQAVCLE